jgi:hypothetical protein
MKNSKKIYCKIEIYCLKMMINKILNNNLNSINKLIHRIKNFNFKTFKIIPKILLDRIVKISYIPIRDLTNIEKIQKN